MKFPARLCWLMMTLLLAGCANMQRAAPPTHSFSGAHVFGATALAFSGDGDSLASGGYRGEVILWSVPRQSRLATFKHHNSGIRALLLQDRFLISAGDDGRIVLSDQASGQIIHQRNSRPVTSMILIGKRLLSGHKDGTLREWRYPDLQPLQQIPLGSPVHALDYHAGIVAVATSHSLLLYDDAFHLQRKIDTGMRTAHDLHFSPDGKLLVAGNWFHLMIWDLEGGKEHGQTTDHDGLITSLDFSPDGQRLATLGRHTDSAIRVWRTDGMQAERNYQAHELCGAMIRFSPDGRWLATASDDESVRLYDLSLPYLPE